MVYTPWLRPAWLLSPRCSENSALATRTSAADRYVPIHLSAAHSGVTSETPASFDAHVSYPKCRTACAARGAEKTWRNGCLKWG
ncbi:hypothetical protein E2C01_042851 [Portunus trituberculatus]|uniref:Uncharacterized protein n=1 Tax=Portunus trituberculatus TaxID=210409 RepID=A0A5B7FNN2_PORTR|nr:hypothetical protein [Portunus trituberculatus]